MINSRMNDDTKIHFPEQLIIDASHQGIDVERLAENALLRMRSCQRDVIDGPYEMSVKIRNPECDFAKCVFEIEFSRIQKNP